MSAPCKDQLCQLSFLLKWLMAELSPLLEELRQLQLKTHILHHNFCLIDDPPICICPRDGTCVMNVHERCDTVAPLRAKIHDVQRWSVFQVPSHVLATFENPYGGSIAEIFTADGSARLPIPQGEASLKQTQHHLQADYKLRKNTSALAPTLNFRISSAEILELREAAKRYDEPAAVILKSVDKMEEHEKAAEHHLKRCHDHWAAISRLARDIEAARKLRRIIKETDRLNDRLPRPNTEEEMTPEEIAAEDAAAAEDTTDETTLIGRDDSDPKRRH